MKKTVASVASVAIALGGCATASKDVATTYASPMQFNNYTCEQITAESARLQVRLSQLQGRLDTAATNDQVLTGVAIILFWPAVFALGGTKEQEAEYGRLKGEHDALRQVWIQKNCMISAAALLTPPPQTPAMSGVPTTPVQSQHAPQALGQPNLGSVYPNGRAAYDAKDYTEALRLLRPEAEKGSADAQALLARLYGNGWGVPKDFNAAYKWARLAADQGEASGQASLGFAYFNGYGVSQNHIEALRWNRLSAGQGNARGQNNLGVAYQQGAGVTQNPTEAVNWYRLSAAQGDPSAQSNLGRMYLNGSGVFRDYGKAVELFRLSAEQGSPLGQGNLGWVFESGFGVAQDSEEAARWYLKAAKQGSEFAQKRLDRAGAVQQAASRIQAKEVVQVKEEQAGAKAQMQTQTVGATQARSAEERLKELKRLYDAGLITPEVYAAQQKSILGN